MSKGSVPHLNENGTTNGSIKHYFGISNNKSGSISNRAGQAHLRHNHHGSGIRGRHGPYQGCTTEIQWKRYLATLHLWHHIASTSSLPILLDTEEEALVLQDNTHENDTAVVIETDGLENTHGKEAAWACLAIGTDPLYRRPDSAHATILLEHGLKALDVDSHHPEALISARSALDYGLDDHLRNSPLALAVSLIPPCFLNASVMTFFPNLLPSICHINSASSTLETQVQTKLKEYGGDIPSLASLVLHSDAAQSVPTLCLTCDRTKHCGSACM
jgi:hypothetical protein